MGVFEQFPYTNFHDLNLDWILKKMKDLDKEVTEYIKNNKIQSADPFNWNIQSQYPANTLVSDPENNTVYLSVQAVPAGVALSNKEYWQSVFTLQALWDALDDVMESVAPINQGTSTQAQQQMEVNELFWMQHKLHIVTVQILRGQEITSANSRAVTIEEMLLQAQSYLSQKINKNAEDIENLQTADTNINARIDNIVSQAGDDNTEIVDARLGASNLGSRTYGSLGSAIREQINKVSSPDGVTLPGNAYITISEGTDSYTITPSERFNVESPVYGRQGIGTTEGTLTTSGKSGNFFYGYNFVTKEPVITESINSQIYPILCFGYGSLRFTTIPTRFYNGVTYYPMSNSAQNAYTDAHVLTADAVYTITEGSDSFTITPNKDTLIDSYTYGRDTLTAAAGTLSTSGKSGNFYYCYNFDTKSAQIVDTLTSLAQYPLFNFGYGLVRFTNVQIQFYNGNTYYPITDSSMFNKVAAGYTISSDTVVTVTQGDSGFTITPNATILIECPLRGYGRVGISPADGTITTAGTRGQFYYCYNFIEKKVETVETLRYYDYPILAFGYGKVRFTTVQLQFYDGNTYYPMWITSTANKLNARKAGFNAAILGDSYSTFKGYNPSNAEIFYPTDEYPTVTTVQDTWWYQLLTQSSTRMIINNAWSGAQVSGPADKVSAYVNRVKALPNCDWFIIEGGLNDQWNGVTVGNYKYSDWTAEDLQQFAPACAYVLDYITTHNLGAHVLWFTVPTQNEEFRTVIKNVCEHYGVEYFHVATMAHDSGYSHPNGQGMKDISSALYNNLYSL